MPMSIKDRLRAGTVLGAEGYVFELERRGYLKAGPFVPEVVLDYPDAVRELHREKLRDVGREGDLEAMNRAAFLPKLERLILTGPSGRRPGP